MNRDPKFFLNDILESIDRIEAYTKGLTEEGFENDDEAKDAVLRRLSVIGEATKNIPSRIKEENREVPWKLMSGLRDVLVHEYFGVRNDTIWRTLKEDLPGVKKQVKAILDSLSKR